MILSIPKKLQETRSKEGKIEQDIAVINSELVTLSKSLAPYLHAKTRLEKRIEYLARRKHRLQRILIRVTKCPPKTGPFSVPVSHPTPTRESFIKKLKGFSKQRLTELGLRLDALGTTTKTEHTSG